MALKKLINVEGEALVNTPFGVVSIGEQKTAFQAYCKITQITGNKQKGEITVEMKADSYKVINKYVINFSTENDSANFIKQAYLELKKMPEWADATDC
jgi:hypothetical protein